MASPGSRVTTAGPGDATGALAQALRAQEQQLLACVHCGFCLDVCPTYTRLGDEADSPRGRLYLMRAVMEERLAPDAEAFRRHIDRCLGCRACETVCPSGVQYGFLLERARAVIAHASGVPASTRVLLRLFEHPVVARFVMAAGRVLRDMGVVPLLLRLVPRSFGRTRFGLAMLGASSATRLASRRHVPAPSVSADRGEEAGADLSLTESTGGAAVRSGGRESPAGQSRRSAAQARGRVALLTGCVQQGLFGRVNRATARVLKANGFEVIRVDAQSCCGALHAHAGEIERARTLARRNVEAFGVTGLDAVIVNAAGCGAMMKEYGELLADEPLYAQRARALSERTRDIFEFLDQVGVVAGGPVPMRAAYDAPCHLYHAQRVQHAPLRVLGSVPGLEVSVLAHYDECCGGAGTYGLMHPQLGNRILDDKVRDVRASGADVVITGNPGCMMQIGAGLLLSGDPRRVLHPIELLAESYRRAEAEP